MEFLRNNQLDIMCALSGACGITALFAGITKSTSAKRKGILIMVELSAMFLLIFDRLNYIYDGVAGSMGCQWV